MPKTALQKYAKRRARQQRGEQPRARKLAGKARVVAKRARTQGPSVGRITRQEGRVVKLLGKSTKTTTTRGEARGVRARARKRARKS